MSYEDFKKLLEDAIAQHSFTEPGSHIGDAFNTGMRTMYFSALTAFLELSQKKEGADE